MSTTTHVRNALLFACLGWGIACEGVYGLDLPSSAPLSFDSEVSTTSETGSADAPADLPTLLPAETGVLDSRNSPPLTTYNNFENVGSWPRWTVRAGVIFLQRGRPESLSLASRDNDDGGGPDTDRGLPDIWNASGYRFNFRGGADITAIRHGEYADVDFRYFGVNQMNASQLISPGGQETNVLFSNVHETFPNSIQSTYATSLQSLESNARQNITSRLTLLAGFRYLSLREKVGASFDTVNPSNAFATNVFANNRLFGFQIGGDAILWDNGGRLRLESVLKAGLFGNAAQNGLVETGLFAPRRVTNQNTHAAFVGDLNFTGVYQINDRWAFRTGYQLLWVSGVAIASDQFPVLNESALGHTVVDTSGTAFFHGVLASVQCSW